jgi:MFS family permease
VVVQGQERADGGQPSIWAPLRNRIYRDLFAAQFVSNIGTFMQGVAAQWFLVEQHSSAVIVALVQTASLGPTLLLGLFAGALADLFDRRRFLIFMQSYAVLVTLALAVLAYLGRLSPTSLLMFTVASWTEFERQRTKRWLDVDSEGVRKAIGYTFDRTRQHEYYLAVRVRR